MNRESRNGTWRAGKSTLHDKPGYYHCGPGSRHDFKYIITINLPLYIYAIWIWRQQKKNTDLFTTNIKDREELSEITKIAEMLNPDEQVLLVAKQSRIKPGDLISLQT